MKSIQFKQLAGQMTDSALQAVDPYRLIKSQVHLQQQNFIFHNQKIDLTLFERIYILGAGKAAAPMAAAFEELLGNYLSAGAVIVKYGHGVPLAKIKLLEAAHPVPDQQTLSGSAELLKIARKATEKDLVIFLLSGGGSSLFEQLPENINLDRLSVFNEQLLSCGASIEEINTLRKHISLVKGGRFAGIVSPARLLTFILSDVIGDPIESIASGPTAADSSTFSDVRNILNKYNLRGKIPKSILSEYEMGLKGQVEETPKPGASPFNNVQNIIVGNNQLALDNLQKTAADAGFKAQILTNRLQGEAREIAKFWAALIESAILTKKTESESICLITGGEPTVTIQGSGLGGRNQELALAVLQQLKHIKQPFYFCSIGTDGTDGPTDAAGAWIDQLSFELSQKANLDILAYLNNNDSYHFFDKLGQLIKTGPTGTNVMDMMFCLL